MAADWNTPTTTTDVSDEDDAPDTFRLAVIAGPDRSAELPLRAGVFTVGKSETCALRVTDPGVSRMHLELHVGAGEIRIRDLDSKNGTHVGGVRISEAALSAGAVIRIGSTLLQLVRRGDPASVPRDRLGALLGSSAPMQEVYHIIERAGPTPSTVLIEAETGCGKELCARALHDVSGRRGPFVICDLAGLNPALIESELFGHERGAFTGASASRTGAFVQADGGTLFIDELGELILGAQPRLLRALEEGMVKPLGASRYRKVDVRVVAATNRDLEGEVAAGRFRHDLYQRLSVIRLRLPPLRHRKEDLPILARHFIGDVGIDLAHDAQVMLAEYDWPGNVRELRNVIERALVLLPSGQRVLRLPFLAASEAERGELASLDFVASRDRLLAAWEAAFLRTLLARAGGNVSAAARLAGVTRIYLHRLLKRHGIKAPEFRR